MRLRGIFLSFTLVACACNPSTLTDSSTYDAACDPILEFPCEAGAESAPGCGANANATSPLERQIPSGKSYPTGCTVIVPHPLKDETGECIFEGSCNCAPTDAGAPLAWKCTI